MEMVAKNEKGAQAPDAGLEMAAREHPLMVQAKTMAKKLVKALREVDPACAQPLMRAQEIVARQMNYPNFKELREKCLSDILEARVKAAGGLEVLGDSDRLGLARCELGLKGPGRRLSLDWESFRGGSLVVGDGAEELSTAIGQEAIRAGKGLTWVDGRGDENALASLVESARVAGRLGDVAIVGGSEPKSWAKGARLMPWRSTIEASPDQMLEFLRAGMEGPGTWTKQTQAWLSCLIPMLCSMRDGGELRLTLDCLPHFGIVELAKLSLRRDQPRSLREGVKSYLAEIGMEGFPSGWPSGWARAIDSESARIQEAAMAPVQQLVSEISGQMGGRWGLGASALGANGWLPQGHSILLMALPACGPDSWSAKWAKACLGWSFLDPSCGGVSMARLLVARDLPPSAKSDALGVNHRDSSVSVCHAWSSLAALERAVSGRRARCHEGIRGNFGASFFAKDAAAQAWEAHRREWPEMLAENEADRARWEWARRGPPLTDGWEWMHEGKALGPWVARVGGRSEAFSPR
jgi:hypothetical protein